SQRSAWAEDWPWGTRPEDASAAKEAFARGWGRGSMAWAFGITDVAEVQAIARAERLASTPTGVQQFMDWLMEIDVRDVLPSITAPTLVANFERHVIWSPEGSRYTAA